MGPVYKPTLCIWAAKAGKGQSSGGKGKEVPKAAAKGGSQGAKKGGKGGKRAKGAGRAQVALGDVTNTR